MKYSEMKKEVLSNVGGVENITKIGHCATRLRIDFIKEGEINKSALEKIDGVFGVVIKSNQVQLIVGGDVPKVYAAFTSDTKFDNIEKNILENKEPKKKDIKYLIDVVGGFFAEIFMPIVPALSAGGIILATNNLLINYFNIKPESGTAVIILAIFSAAFSLLPVYLGYTTARKFNLPPILGAFLGGFLINGAISGAVGLDFFGIPVPTVEYGGSILPVILGVIFMFYIDKVLDKAIPEFGKYLLKPFLTMIIVVPFTLIIFGPLGTVMSEYVGLAVMWLMDKLGLIIYPVLSVFYPYMVMLGLDKALMPIGFQAVEAIGYDPFNMVVGFISNLAVGSAALALALHVKKDKETSGAYFSFGLTGVFGITEPAFYGALIGKPKALLGVAIGALSGGIVASILALKSYVMGGAPGLFTIMFFVNPDGSMGNLIASLVVAAVSIGVTFVATTLLLKTDKNKL